MCSQQIWIISNIDQNPHTCTCIFTMYMYINSCFTSHIVYIWSYALCAQTFGYMFIVDIIIYMYHHKLNNFNMEIMFGITAYII